MIRYRYPTTSRLTGQPSDWAQGDMDEDQEIDDEDGDMRQDSGSKLATGIAIFNVAVTLGGFLYFGGQLAQRVTHSEEEIKELKTNFANNASASAVSNAQIAVVSSQMTDMRVQMAGINTSMNDLNSKLPRRP